MLNYPLPLNASTTRVHIGASCATTGDDPASTYTLRCALAERTIMLDPASTTFPVLILKRMHSSDRAVHSQLFCGDHLINVDFTTRTDTNLNYVCPYRIYSAQYNPLGPLIIVNEWSEIITVPYANAMTATDTPYTGYTFQDNGQEFSYNPLNAQVGIFLWVITFIFFVSCSVWIFKKL